MATVASIVTNLRANTGQFNKAMEDAERRTTHFKRHAEGGVLGGLKGAVGRGSGLFEVSHLLEGRGPIMGLTLLSGAFSEAAKTAAEMRKQLDAGVITVAEYKSRLWELIPVLGAFAKTGREIGESLREAFPTKVELNLKEQMGAGGAAGLAIKNVVADNRAAHLAGMEEQARERTEEAERHRKRMEDIRAERGALTRIADEAKDNLVNQLTEAPKGSSIFENIKKQIDAISGPLKGGGTEEFQTALAVANAARSRLANYELLTRKLGATESETHAANLRRIMQGPSGLLPFINGAGGIGTGIKDLMQNFASGIKAVHDALQTGADDRTNKINSIADIYRNLKEHQHDPLKLAGDAIEKGSREDIMSRQQRLFRDALPKESSEQLMKEAIAKYDKMIAEQKDTNKKIGALLDKLQVKKVEKMAIIKVSEDHKGRCAKRELDSITYTREFLVLTNAWLTDGATQVRQATGVPRVYDPHNDDPTVRARSVEVEPEQDDGNFWRVRVEYTSNLPIQVVPSEDPLDRPKEVSWYFQPTTIFMERSYDNQNNLTYPIENSAHMPYPPFEVESSIPTLQIVRNEMDYSPGRALAYMNTVNSDVFYTAPVGTAKLVAINAASQYEGNHFYWRTTYLIQFKEDGWERVVQDKGTHEYYSPPGGWWPIKSKDTDGNPTDDVTEPVFLNGAGRVLPAGEPIAYRTFFMYRQKPFAALNLE